MPDAHSRLAGTRKQVLHTDADMQKADWMTGVAAIAGIIGMGCEFWFADAAAAGLISVGILKDGIRELGAATAELVDGAPRALEQDVIAEEASILKDELQHHFGDCEVRLRESGRVIHAEIAASFPPTVPPQDELWPGEPDRSWRFARLSFVPLLHRGSAATARGAC